jgi:hypothetical protein
MGAAYCVATNAQGGGLDREIVADQVHTHEQKFSWFSARVRIGEVRIDSPSTVSM